MRRSGVALAAAACLTALAGCGGAARPPDSPAADREWATNAKAVIRILLRDLDLSTSGGATVAAARHSLHDGSTLYTILVAYTDFGGCDHMVASTGPPPPRFARTDRALRAACVPFERAADLFGRATRSSNAHTLLAATRTALKGSPPLEQARLDLAAAQSAASG